MNNKRMETSEESKESEKAVNAWHVYYGELEHMFCGDPLYAPVKLGTCTSFTEAREMAVKRAIMVSGAHHVAKLPSNVAFKGWETAPQRAIFSDPDPASVPPGADTSKGLVPLLRDYARVYFATKTAL